MHLRMLGAAGTTVVTGNGLGPDLRVPVPFVMARRKGASAQFISVHEPFVKGNPIVTVREIRPGVISILTQTALDEIVVEPGKFSYKRTPRTASDSK